MSNQSVTHSSESDSNHTLAQPIDDLISRLNARRRKASQEPLLRILITESQSVLGRSIMQSILKNYTHVHIHAGVANVDTIKLTDFNDLLDADPRYPARLHFLSTPYDWLKDESNNQPTDESTSPSTEAVNRSKSTLIRAFQGVDAAFILPNDIEIDVSGRAYIEAAKQAKTRFVALYGLTDCSQSMAECAKLQLASLYRPLEQALADTGLSHCVLRAPMFLDDFVQLHYQSINQSSTFSTPVTGDKCTNYCTQSDFSDACARVLTDPREKHECATYAILSKGTLTYQSIADCLTQFSHREIKYTKCTKQEMINQLHKLKLKQWVIDGLIEQYQQHEEERQHVKEQAPDFQSITRKEPETYREYFKAVAPRFK